MSPSKLQEEIEARLARDRGALGPGRLVPVDCHDLNWFRYTLEIDLARLR
jgi:hypothetical protein